MISAQSRRSRPSRPLRTHIAVALWLVSGLAWPTPVGSTPYFWGSAFERQWQQDEAIIPGFWGPLPTATARLEPYAGDEASDLCPTHPPPTPPGVTFACAGVGHPDQRAAQYFDRGRMESILLDYTKGGPKDVLTNGLLTVELTNGQVQTGDNRFEQRAPAQLSIAGDPGNDGPTYTDLAGLPARDTDTGTTRLPYAFTRNRQWEHAQVSPQTIAPQMLTYVRMGDPGGRYDQNVLTAFAEVIHRLPSGLAAVGWPIAPVFFLQAPINGAPTTLIAQAFERRVLTYNPGSVPERRVASGAIGSDYYTWRYGLSDSMRYGPPPIVVPTPPIASNGQAPTPTATMSGG